MGVSFGLTMARTWGIFRRSTICWPWPRNTGIQGSRSGARSPYAGVFHRRHPTLLTPRDFDLSPFFEIVKFNVIDTGSFDYRRIDWADPSPPTTADE